MSQITYACDPSASLAGHLLRRLAAQTIGVIAAVVLLTIAGPAVGAEQGTGPNIILILADDLGYGDLGCYGQTKIRTPNIDRLAAEGVRFTRHYSGAPVCAPARCVLMTGKHSGHAYIRNNLEHKPEGQEPIPAGEVTIAELLSGRGYVCGAFGKWGLGYPGSEGDPMNQGFARFYGYNCQRVAHSYYPPHLWSDRDKIMLDNDPPVPGHGRLAADADPADAASYAKWKGKDYAPDRIHEQVLAFIRANKDRPFFCYYPEIIPHLALHVPDEELEPYLKLGWKETPFTGNGYAPHRTPRAAYAAMISRMDRYVGNVLKLLDELGIADNTIVVFTSDNGPTHVNPEVDVEFFESAGGLRGLKGSMYEGGIRVPMIVRWPGRTKPGSTSDRVTGFEDWMATLMEAAGAGDATPKECDGISFLPTVLGERQEPRPWLMREFGGYGGQQALWMGDWKAVRRELNKGKLEIELYNLATDEREQHNKAADHPDAVAQMRAILVREHTPSKVFAIKALDAEQAAAGRPQTP